jgi:hypothetical protein
MHLALLGTTRQVKPVLQASLHQTTCRGRTCYERALLRGLACLLAIALSQSLANASGSSLPPTKEEITAAFIINFARFTEWPPPAFPSADSPLTVGVLGAEDVRAALESFAGGKELNGRKVIIRSVNSAADARACQVIYILTAKENILADVLKTARDSGTLTIGESEGMFARGAMIRLFVENAKMRFDVNLKATIAAKIHLSSRLLALARYVVDLPEQGGY